MWQKWTSRACHLQGWVNGDHFHSNVEIIKWQAQAQAIALGPASQSFAPPAASPILPASPLNTTATKRPMTSDIFDSLGEEVKKAKPSPAKPVAMSSFTTVQQESMRDRVELAVNAHANDRIENHGSNLIMPSTNAEVCEEVDVTDRETMAHDQSTNSQLFTNCTDQYAHAHYSNGSSYLHYFLLFSLADHHNWLEFPLDQFDVAMHHYLGNKLKSPKNTYACFVVPSLDGPRIKYVKGMIKLCDT